MNISGLVAFGAFLLTLLTVLAALTSYVIYKARERTRRRLLAADHNPFELQYFVEFVPPIMMDDVTNVFSSRGEQEGRSQASNRWPRVLIYAAAVFAVLASVSGVYVCNVGWRAVKSNAPLGAKGPEAGSASRTPAQLAFDRLISRRPSIFPASFLDENNDERLQPEEMARLHEVVPQFVVVTSDDNGHRDGLHWMKTHFGSRGVWQEMTFFMTANYLSGRKNDLGRGIESTWQDILNENHLGLHGTTHEEGGESWTLERWMSENQTVQDELVQRLKLPSGWSWSRYFWGSRAPILMFTDTYFASLTRLKHPIVYDSSLIVHPGGTEKTTPPEDEVRVVSWPFTMDHPIPADVDAPYLEKAFAHAEFSRHSLWEMPVYAWYLHPRSGYPRWEPSLDFNLWKYHGCQGMGPNRAIVTDVMSNLAAHYRGNRAPFHIGLHAHNYEEHEACKRSTMLAILDEIGALAKQKGQVKFISIPDLLVWMDGLEAPRRSTARVVSANSGEEDLDDGIDGPLAADKLSDDPGKKMTCLPKGAPSSATKKPAAAPAAGADTPRRTARSPVRRNRPRKVIRAPKKKTQGAGQRQPMGPKRPGKTDADPLQQTLDPYER